jgi:transcriptional regulator with XRE-family HTH domain
VQRVIDDARAARIAAGLTQDDVGKAIGVSHARVGRFERGEIAQPELVFMSAYCAVVGLDLSIRSYPAGDPIRDRAHLALLERFRARLHPSLRWRTEVPLPIEGDLRAWDAEIRPAPPDQWRARVEAETRIADGQALERKLALKLRDDPGGYLILLLSDTKLNRATLRHLRDSLRPTFPLDTRAILAALRAGVDPGGSGIVIM